MKHEEILIYCYIRRWYWIKRGDNSSTGFYITKSELRELTGIYNISGIIESLYKGFTFSSGQHLLEYTDRYHQIYFDKILPFADPAENENNRKQAERYKQEIRRLAGREPKQTTPTSRSDAAEQLFQLFCDLHKQVKGRVAPRYNSSVVTLGELSQKHGFAKVKKAIEIFLDPESYPDGIGRHPITLSTFFYCLEDILQGRFGPSKKTPA
jgi:hypothetical protein